MSFREELARAMADKEFYEEEIRNHTDIKGKRKTGHYDEQGNPIEEDYTDPRDDGLNPHRMQSIEQTKKTIAKLNDFETGRSQAVNLAAEQSRRNIAQRLAGVNTQSNARGMLYSNYNQGRKAKERATEATSLGGRVTDINTHFENAYDQNQHGLISNQMDEYRRSVNDAQANYKKALKDYQTKGNTGAAIGSAIGTVAGSFAQI